MNECRKIESLLYLFREGELSPREREKVLEHTKACTRCREILTQLASIDDALLPLREASPELIGGTSLVNETISLISREKGDRRAPEIEASLVDRISFWLRPALGVIVLTGIILYVAQQSRDAVKLDDLEKRLQVYGAAAAMRDPYGLLGKAGSSDLALLGRGDGRMFTQLQSSSIGGSPISFIGSGLLDLFRENRGLFEEFKKRYPNLASIKLDEGIGERERKILATEGKAFMKEFEKLLQEGEQ